MRRGRVFETVRRLVRRLEAANLPCAIVGGLAVGEHGYARATEAVDVLVTREGLERFRQDLVGRGYVPAFPQARTTFLDPETRVRIEMLTTGDFPGDGRPKPVSFPHPDAVAVQGPDFRMVDLRTLVELKLASGISAPHRLRDLADVQDLIRAAHLPRDLSARLDPSVRARCLELWDAVHAP